LSFSLASFAPEIYTRSFNNGDSLSLDLRKPGADSYVGYFALRSHFLYGSLSFTITDSNGNFTIYPVAGDRFWLTDCEIQISYNSAWSPCEITVFLILPRTCTYTIHARNQKSATISVPSPDFPMNETVCYFLEFRRDVHISLNHLSRPDWMSIYYPMANGTVRLLEVNQTEIDMGRLFLAVLKKSTDNPLKLSFTTSSVSSDWTDVDGPFRAVNGPPQQAPVESFGLVTDRVLPWWLWLLLIGGGVACGAVFAFVLFWHSPSYSQAGHSATTLTSDLHPPAFSM
jgi:hypothetical protein